jgi:ABC-type Fe3+-hydroxamate transport system substrate-binding protein
MHLDHASARSRRRGRLGAAALALAVVVAACSSGDDDTADDTAGDAGSSDGTADSAAFPVTIEHKYGETTIEAAPERVVSVGFADQDPLLALGIVPVAIRAGTATSRSPRGHGRHLRSATPSRPCCHRPS